MREKIAALVKQVRLNRFDRSLMRYFDWPLFLNVLVIALFGVVCIFSATTTSVTETPATGNAARRFRARAADVAGRRHRGDDGHHLLWL